MQYEWKDDGLFQPLGIWLLFFPIVGFVTLLLAYIPVKVIQQLTDWEQPWDVWWWLAEHIYYDFFFTYTSTLILVILASRYSYFQMWYFRTLEQLRRREFELDLRRYEGTPYVPALAIEYLMQPSASYNAKEIEGQYTFYRHIVGWFRSSIYLHKGNDFVKNRYHYSKLIAPYLWKVVLGAIALSGTLIYIKMKWGFSYFWNDLWLGYGKVAFGVPFFIVACWFLAITWGLIRYRMISLMFKKEDYLSEVKWIEVMPGTYFAECFEDANKLFQRSLIEVHGKQATDLPGFPNEIFPEEMPRNLKFYHYSGDESFDNIGSDYWNIKEAKAIYTEKPHWKKAVDSRKKEQISLKKGENSSGNVISLQNVIREKKPLR